MSAVPKPLSINEHKMKFSCQYCEQHIDADPNMAGMIMTCPTCGKEISIPKLGGLEDLDSGIRRAPIAKWQTNWRWLGAGLLLVVGLVAFTIFRGKGHSPIPETLQAKSSQIQPADRLRHGTEFLIVTRLPPQEVSPDQPSLPADFRFLGLTKPRTRSVLPIAVGGIRRFYFRLTGTNQIWFFDERDAVAGLHGGGLNVRQVNMNNYDQFGRIVMMERQTDGISSSYEFLWTPEPFACYRQGRLLGIYDPRLESFRKAYPNEAPQQLSLQPGSYENNLRNSRPTVPLSPTRGR